MAQRKALCIICNVFKAFIHLNIFVEHPTSARRCGRAKVEEKPDNS